MTGFSSAKLRLFTAGIQMNKLIVTYINDPFDPLNSRQIKELEGSHSIQECINEFTGKLLPGYDFVVSINGEPLPDDEDFAHYWVKEGSIAICAVPQGGGGKNILRTIAMIALVVVTVIYAPELTPAALSTLLGSEAAATALVATAMMTVGNLIINAVLPVNTDLTGTGLGDFSQSATYGWDTTQNETREGSTWPILYGKTRITPPIIGRYIDVVKDKQYLNLLFGIADHSLSTLDTSTIQISGNTISTSDHITCETRLGSLTQPVIQAFNDTRSTKSVGSKVSTTWTTVTTAGNSVEGLGVSLSLPKGLWYAADDGSLTSTSVKLYVEYAPTAATTGNWIGIQTKLSSDSTATIDRWSAGYWTSYGNWGQIEVGSTSATQHTEGEKFTPPPTYWFLWITSVQVQMGRTFVWRWMSAGENYNAWGASTSTDYITITAHQSTPLRKTYYKDHVTEATTYDVRIKFQTAPSSTSRYGNDVYFDYVEETIYDDFCYPGSSLLSIRALATDRISGGIPEITIEANRVSVPVWNSTTSTYDQCLANNPAWASYDMLHNGIYGGNIPADRINYTDFATWATYCSANSLECNIYFDSALNFRKALDMIGQLGRGRVVQLGSTFTCFVDKAESTPVQGFMFNVANMTKNSFSEQFLPMDDRANAVEITYWDKNFDYDRKTIELYSDDFDTTTREIKTTQISLIGCIDRDMAIKHGKYLLNCNRYQTITACWEADIDSIACMPWDVVEVQHDVPQWGYGGRIASSTISTAVLDQQITMATSGAYVIRVQSSATDTVQEKTITAVLAETTTSTISLVATFDSIPATYDLYTIYENTTQTKWFRILQLGRKDDLTRKITAIEYNANIYTGTATCAIPENASELDMVKDLRAEEVWKGGAETRVQVAWTGFAMAWHVWHRRTSGENIWTDDGIVRDPSIEIKNLDYGMEYEICVSYTNNIKDGLTTTITPSGKTTAPADVTGLVATSIEDGVSFSWTKVTDFDLVGYKIRTGVKWQAATTYLSTVCVIPTDGSNYQYVCLTGGKTSATTEPSWPTASAATITDGTVIWQEATASWVWQQTSTVNFTRNLDASEMEAQAKGNFSISAWAVGVDAFDNVSDTAATITGICNNYKPYISVGPTTVQGTFTDFKKAVDQLPSGGGQIVIKNGTYNLTDTISIPAKNLYIAGESQEGTILNMTEKNKIVFQWESADHAGLQQSFTNFTINSGNSTSATYNAMFYISSSTTGKFNVLAECLSFNLYDDGTTNGTGDIGIFVLNNCKADLILKKSTFNNGLRAVRRASAIANIIVDNNVFNGQKGYAIASDCKYGTIQYNHFIEQYYCGVFGSAVWTDGTYKILGNSIVFSTSASGDITGIIIMGTVRSEISGNVILMPVSTYSPDTTGISISGALYSCTGVLCNSNQIDIHSDTKAALGIDLATDCSDSNVLGNVIKMDSTNASGVHYGIYLGPICCRNIISGNQIDLVNTGSNDKAIYILASGDNNQGINNVFYNCGVGVVDNGAGNAINKIGAGTF